MCANSNSKFLLFFILLSPLVARADELVLKEGKTIQGRITKEDSSEYTILIGSNMFLRVAKNKVSKVVRTTPPKKERPTVRMNDLHAVSTATAKSPAAATGAPAAKSQATAGVGSSFTKHDAVTFEKTIVAGTGSANTSWTSSWEGTPGKEGDQFKWKWAVLRATITTNAADPHSAGLAAIYTEEAKSFADEMVALRAPDEVSLRREATRLYGAMKSQAAKKQSGYERRTKKMFDTPAK